MDSNDLFSHTEQPTPATNAETSAEPVSAPIFSDRPKAQPRADVPWSS